MSRSPSPSPSEVSPAAQSHPTSLSSLPPSLSSPIIPLIDSYTYHSPKPTAHGPYILGVDEAGRGPVLGPLVYAVAYCPIAYQETLDGMGFADSKTLTHDTRTKLLQSLSGDSINLGWSVRVLSPQDISAGMLRLPPINLNQQSQEATVLLIREVLAAGLEISAIYVDALGPSVPYQAYLSSVFPGISITVKPKADSLYTIVGAASVAAKVTRDAWIENWKWEELSAAALENGNTDIQMIDTETPLPKDHEVSRPILKGFDQPIGSGYPSDPNTKSWLKSAFEPTFGFPSLVRFSWATVKIMFDAEGHKVQWNDEKKTSLKQAFKFGSAKAEHDDEQNRSPLAKELSIYSVSDI